jgi:hypothetical protein
MGDAEMTVDEIRAELKGTFRRAETIWGQDSPFKNSSTWIGYAGCDESVKHLDDVIGNEADKFVPGDPRHYSVSQLIHEMLPQDGTDLFDQGFEGETVYVNPPAPGWTPTVIVVSLATDPKDGDRQFTLITGACGALA